MQNGGTCRISDGSSGTLDEAVRENRCSDSGFPLIPSRLRFRSRRRVLVPEHSHRSHPDPEILNAHPFIRSVSVFSGKPEADQQNRRPKHLLEISNDRNRAAFPNDYGLFLERRSKRAPRRVVKRSVQLGPPGFPAVQIFHGCDHTLRRDTLDMRLHQADDFLRSLVGNESAAHLRHRLGGQNSLRTFPRVSAEKAVDLTGRAGPESLQSSEAGLTRKLGDPGFMHEVFLIEWKRPHLRADLRTPFLNRIVKPIDCDVSIRIVERGEYSREGHCRIGYGSAVPSRMKIRLRPGDIDLEVGEPSQG